MFRPAASIQEPLMSTRHRVAGDSEELRSVSGCPPLDSVRGPVPPNSRSAGFRGRLVEAQGWEGWERAVFV